MFKSWAIEQEKKAVRWALRRFWSTDQASVMLDLIYAGKTSVLLSLWETYNKGK